VTQNVLKLS